MSFNTCLNLIKREYYVIRSLIFWLSIIITMLLFFFAFNALQLTQPEQSISLLHGGQLLYSVTGVVVASLAFWEFKNSAESRHYLLLPATDLEKITAKVIFYIFGWLVLFIACWAIAILCATGILAIVAPIKLEQFRMVVCNVLKMSAQIMPITILYQSLSLFASCYFRRFVFLKLAVCYVLIILPLQAIISHEILNVISSLSGNRILMLEAIWSQLSGTAELAVIFSLWSITWLCLSETEAS